MRDGADHAHTNQRPPLSCVAWARAVSAAPLYALRLSGDVPEHKTHSLVPTTHADPAAAPTHTTHAISCTAMPHRAHPDVAARVATHETETRLCPLDCHEAGGSRTSMLRLAARRALCTSVDVPRTPPAITSRIQQIFEEHSATPGLADNDTKFKASTAR